MVRAAIVAMALLAASPVLAHDGFEGLESPYGGVCCGKDDCAGTETRFKNGQLQAHILVYDLWVDVPDKSIMPAELNPLTGAAICWLAEVGVLCFFPGRGS